MDSNRRFVKPELLKKNIAAFKHYCPTLSATENKRKGSKQKVQYQNSYYNMLVQTI